MFLPEAKTHEAGASSMSLATGRSGAKSGPYSARTAEGLAFLRQPPALRVADRLHVVLQRPGAHRRQHLLDLLRPGALQRLSELTAGAAALPSRQQPVGQLVIRAAEPRVRVRVGKVLGDRLPVAGLLIGQARRRRLAPKLLLEAGEGVQRAGGAGRFQLRQQRLLIVPLLHHLRDVGSDLPGQQIKKRMHA